MMESCKVSEPKPRLQLVGADRDALHGVRLLEMALERQ